jgi:hypothetical protein
MRHGLRRLAATAAGAALVLLSAAPAALPAVHRTLAADRGLVITSHSRYDAIPEDARVRVTIDATATSYTPNSGTTIYYYPATIFDVQPGITHLSASSGTKALGVTVLKATADFTELKVTFNKRVFYQQSYAFRVTFDLPDPGGLPNRNLRIGESIIAFPVWAFGTAGEPGSTVEVVLPSGFTPNVQGDQMAIATGSGGEVVLSATSIPDPAEFFAYLSADRPGAFVTSTFSVPVLGTPATVDVLAWEDDRDWGARLTELMTDGLPTLADQIGLDWPVKGDLKVEEAAISRLGEYAGMYNDTTQTIRVRYDADGVVALHEAAHIWFNGSLFRDRWVLEAWAEFYGVQATAAVGASGQAYDLTDDLLASKIPLNDWGALGTVDATTESYAYAASYHLATLIFARTDLPGLRLAWRAAHDGEMAYQPANPGDHAETGRPPGLMAWQELLDLLEERTGANYDDLWSAWVVNEAQAPLMGERATARVVYESVVADAATWNLPTSLRLEMGAWRFDAARSDLDAASAVLDERDQIADGAVVLDLTPPATLKAAFEGDAGMDAAKAEADQELALLAAIKAAEARLAEAQNPFEVIGLIGADAERDLDAARDDFEAGKIGDGALAADRAVAARDGAEAAGQVRAAFGGVGLLAIGGSAVGAVRVRRRRGVGGRVPLPPR